MSYPFTEPTPPSIPGEAVLPPGPVHITIATGGIPGPVASLEITAAGSGYSWAALEFDGGGGAGASGTATVDPLLGNPAGPSGPVGTIVLDHAGHGLGTREDPRPSHGRVSYPSGDPVVPTVYLLGGGGTLAAAHVTLVADPVPVHDGTGFLPDEFGYKVATIVLDVPGDDYTAPPIVFIGLQEGPNEYYNCGAYGSLSKPTAHTTLGTPDGSGAGAGPSGGTLTAVTLTAPGTGYKTAPIIRVLGDGTGATVVAHLGGITRVDFYVDGVLAGSNSVFPYDFTWSPSAVGKHVIVAIAVTPNTVYPSGAIYVNASSGGGAPTPPVPPLSFAGPDFTPYTITIGVQGGPMGSVYYLQYSGRWIVGYFAYGVWLMNVDTKAVVPITTCSLGVQAYTGFPNPAHTFYRDAYQSVSNYTVGANWVICNNLESGVNGISYPLSPDTSYRVQVISMAGGVPVYAGQIDCDWQEFWDAQIDGDMAYIPSGPIGAIWTQVDLSTLSIVGIVGGPSSETPQTDIDGFTYYSRQRGIHGFDVVQN